MELLPVIDTESNVPLYHQLYHHFRDEIEAGRLREGARLPSIRKLANHLGMSRTPIEAAYQQLLAEGYVDSHPRSSMVVRAYDPTTMTGQRPQPAISPKRNHLHTAASSSAQPFIDFHYGAVDLDHFPFPLWKKLLGRCFDPDQRHLFQYGDPLGEYGFRQALADYAYRARAVVCTPEQLMVGAGSHHSIEQLCRLLRQTPFHPAQTAVAVEQSMSDGMAAVMRHQGYRLIPIRLEDDGLHLDELYASGARIVYVTPSHQFPYGMVMPIGKRRKLLQWARDVDGLIIEDDYDGEFRYGGLPIPSLQGLDTDGHVVYLGTFSRALAPAFRLSYTALPPLLAAVAAQALHPFDRLASPLYQRTLELFMTEGHLQRHIRKMRSVYQRKYTALMSAIKQTLEPHVVVHGSSAGMHILLDVPEAPSEQWLIDAAAAAQVRVYPASVYRITALEEAPPDSPPTVLIGFGGNDEQQLVTGIQRLRLAWQLPASPDE